MANPVKEAPFTLKLLEMIKRPENITSTGSQKLLDWSEDGESIILREPKEFGKILLPFYFKHTNYLSFIRQLNGHGFRKNEDIPLPNIHFPYKITASDQPEQQVLVYTHDHFKRDHPENYYLVQREHSKNYKKLVEMGLLKIDDPLAAKQSNLENRKRAHYRPEYVESNFAMYQNYKQQIQQSSEEIKIILDKMNQENQRLQAEQNLLQDSLDSTNHSMRYLAHLLIQMVKAGNTNPELKASVMEVKQELCRSIAENEWVCAPDDYECKELKVQVQKECNSCGDDDKMPKITAVDLHVQSPNSSVNSPPTQNQVTTQYLNKSNKLAEKITDITENFTVDQLGILQTVIGENDKCLCPCAAVKRLKTENTLEVDDYAEWEKRFQPDFDPLEKFEGLNV